MDLEHTFYLKGSPTTQEIDSETALFLARDEQKLERELRWFTGAAHCAVIHEPELGRYLALRAVGVGFGDSVLCSGLAPNALVQGILLTGATPMLVDINPNTFNIDPYCLEYVITKCIRTKRPLPKALLCNDIFGLPCSYQAIEEICRRYGIVLIEDMQESLGASIEGRFAGSFGRFAVASFAQDPEAPEEGEGGAVFCQNELDKKEVRRLWRQTRQSSNMLKAICQDTVRAHLTLQRIENLRQQVLRRQAIAKLYKEQFAGKLKVQQIPRGAKSAYSRFAVLVPANTAPQAIAKSLMEHGVISADFAATAGEQPVEDWNRVMLTNSRAALSRLLLIPIHPHLTDHVAKQIAACVLDAV